MAWGSQQLLKHELHAAAVPTPATLEEYRPPPPCMPPACSDICMFTHTNMHACMHAHTHTHTLSLSLSSPNLFLSQINIHTYTHTSTHTVRLRQAAVDPTPDSIGVTPRCAPSASESSREPSSFPFSSFAANSSFHPPTSLVLLGDACF